MKKNIIVVGLGGQGVVKLSQLISKIALTEGYEARMTSQQGMAQREGAVISHVRYGDVNTPLVPQKSANYLISMEAGETLRYKKFLNKNSKILINSEKIESIDTARGKGEYPEIEKIHEEIKKQNRNIKLLPAKKIAEKLNLPVAANMYMLGSFIGSQNKLTKETAEKVIEKEFSDIGEDALNKNIKLFEKGYNFERENEE